MKCAACAASLWFHHLAVMRTRMPARGILHFTPRAKFCRLQCVCSGEVTALMDIIESRRRCTKKCTGGEELIQKYPSSRSTRNRNIFMNILVLHEDSVIDNEMTFPLVCMYLLSRCPARCCVTNLTGKQSIGRATGDLHECKCNPAAIVRWWFISCCFLLSSHRFLCPFLLF